jgi:5-carboxyvanillate decarboxylase
MRIIDAEAHFYTTDYIEHLRKRKSFPYEVNENGSIKLYYNKTLFSPRGQKLSENLIDMDKGRIKNMDTSGISTQILSLSNPGIQMWGKKEALVWAKRTNDDLAAVIKKHPDRFIGLAAVATQDPDNSAAEIERCVTKLGIKGINILSHSENEYLDNKKFWPIFEAAEKMGAPIYIHPAMPSTKILGGYEDYGFPLAGPILGFAADVSLHTMRLIYAGLFDKFPKLQLILGHLGEGLPYWLPRLDFAFLKPWVQDKPKIDRKPSEYLCNNVYITTSGIFFQPALICAALAMGVDRIMFAVDYPNEQDQEALHFMNEAPFTPSEKEKMLHGNAEKLFNIL